MTSEKDPLAGVPPALARTFKQNADMTEGDRRVAEKEAKRLDETARNQVTEEWYGVGKGGPKNPKMDGPRPPGGRQNNDYRDFNAAVERKRNLMAKEEYNRVKSIGETKLKNDLAARER